MAPSHTTTSVIAHAPQVSLARGGASMDRPPRFRLQSARRRLGLTQLDLATRLSLSPTTISRWERGRARPRMRHLDQLARILGEPVGALRELHARPVTAPPERVKRAADRIAAALDSIAGGTVGYGGGRANGTAIAV
jgi:DNA-binding XRE family transcriptional regulator